MIKTWKCTKCEDACTVSITQIEGKLQTPFKCCLGKVYNNTSFMDISEPSQDDMDMAKNTNRISVGAEFVSPKGIRYIAFSDMTGSCETHCSARHEHNCRAFPCYSDPDVNIYFKRYIY